MTTPRPFPLIILAILLSLFTPLEAGPPYVTDDPEPVELHHWEIDIASQDFKTADGWTGTAPHMEINYGAAPGLQLHLLVQDAFDAPKDGTKHIGYGDTELGFKLRFIDEEDGKWWPQVAIYPAVELPTGNHALGLGNGKAQVYLPVWLQKDFGKWSTFGGGGWWYNPGDLGNRDYWFAGWQVQRKITDKFALGVEIFHNTQVSVDGISGTGVNMGFTLDLTDTYHIIGSAGHSVEGPGQTYGYLGLQITFGPEKKDKEKESSAK